MKKKLIGVTKRAWSFILGIGAFFGAILASVQFYDWAVSPNGNEYNESGIPLVYMDVADFREFLDDSSGETVFFDTRIIFDDAIGINHLAHQICGYDEFLDAVRNDHEAIDSFMIGIMEFKDGFVEPAGNYHYSAEKDGYLFAKETINNVSCYDRMRIKVKDPSSLRLSFGGTGTISLPLYGNFLIEKRYYGVSTEYTLREI